MSDVGMLKGRLWDKILLFAIPLALSSIIQQLFNSADVAVVGQFAGSQALAAVGANGAIINLLVNSFVGLSVGTNVVISQLLGQERTDKVKDTVYTSLILAVVSGIILLIVGLLFATQMLELISTPENIMSSATLYLRIYFMGVPFIMLYNFEAAILRSVGNTMRPLISLSVSGVINVILNLFFVVVLHMNIEGVAIATVISNIISSIDLFFYLLRDKSIISISLKDFHIDFSILTHVLKVGFPAAMQGAVFSISNLILQSFVNSFGDIAIAGTTAALNFEYFAFYLLSAFGQAAVTFTGQNYGAGQIKRCLTILKITLIETFIGEIILCGTFLLFDDFFIRIFTNDIKVIEIAKIRLFWLLGFELFNSSIEVISGALRGMGNSLLPTLISVAGICGVRIIWVFTVLPMHRTYDVLVMCYPVSWIFTVIGLIIAYYLFMKPKLKNA